MLNCTQIQGRNVADIELKMVGDNIPVAEFTLAWSEKIGDKENKCFLRCKAWRKTAELIKNWLGNKGQEYIVEGNLLTESWEKDGKTQSKTILNVSRVHFVGKKSDNAGTAGNVPQGFVLDEEENSEEIPF